MSELKCPFCNSELDMDMCGECGCPNEQCKKSVFMFGSEELWQELIRTRKALETIKKEMNNEYMPDFAVIRDALKTVLKQKEEK